MKKFKIGLSLLMSLVMVFSVFSFGAFAAADTEIDTIELNFNAKPGDSFEDWAEQLSIQTEGIAVSETMEEYGLGVLVIGEDEMITGTYEMGETYLITICLEPKDGYSFPDSAEEFESVTVNGEPAEVMVESAQVLTVKITVTAVIYELVIGGTIESVDASLNIYGDMAVSDWYRYLKINSQGIEALYGEADTVRAYDKDGNPVIGKFVSGEEYTVELWLTAKKNCEFKKNEAGEAALDSVKLSGNDVDYTLGTYEYEDTQYEYIKLETTVTAKEPKYIESVDVTLRENLEGMPVYDWQNYVTINTEGLSFLGEDYYSVEVYDYFGNFVYDSFEQGNIYNIFIYMTPEEGYFLPHQERLETVTLNGRQLSDDEVFYYEDYETGAVYMEIYTQVDMVGDGIWAQIMFFFQKLTYWFQSLFFGFILF
ncbi:MAG: hypothetical protein IKK49_03650 [Clostridia bacterium]|nr:hypothetical protein [Clostridia bacterium]